MPDDIQAPDVQNQPFQDPAQLAAVQQVLSQSPSTAQPILKPPTATTGYGMPAVISMIGQMIHPTATLQPGQMPRQPSRLDAFENFLGSFVSSLGSGLAASGTGPGANIRGAAGALNQPHQAALQQYQLQQQAAQQQASLAQQRAETAAIPQRLENEHQIAMANLGLRESEMQFTNLLKQSQLSLAQGKFDLSKHKADLAQSNTVFEQNLKTKAQQLQSGNIQSQIQARNDSMSERKWLDGQVVDLRQQANSLRQQGLNNQADMVDIQADNATNRIGMLASFESAIGVRPAIQVPTKPSRTPAPSGAKAPSKVDTLVNKYGPG